MTISEILKRKKLIITISIAVVVVAYITFSTHGLLKRISLENRKSELHSKITEALKQKDSLNKRIKYLTFDTFEIERAARVKYGMVKKGEKVIYIPKK